MGLFLALSGVVGVDSEAVRKALSDYANSHGGGFELHKGTTDEPNIGVVTCKGPNTTVIYPDGFCEWDDVSRHISEQLACPVFSLHIHDGDFWMFVLFKDGKEIGWFNPIPEYWEELSEEDRAKWAGDASLVANLIPSTSTSTIECYLTAWDTDEETNRKAYPDDEFCIGDCWQMCDFMRKVGLDYPMGNDGAIHGDTFRFWTKTFRLRTPRPAPSQPEPKKRPWWRLW
jgi:hypothetical protein